MEELSSTELWSQLQRSDQYRNFRLLVRKRAKYKCTNCDTKGNRKNRLHVHHILPKSQGRHFKHVISVKNATLLCQKCHIEEHKEMKSLDPNYNMHKKVTILRLKNFISKCTFEFRKNKRRRYYNRKRRK